MSNISLDFSFTKQGVLRSLRSLPALGTFQNLFKSTVFSNARNESIYLSVSSLAKKWAFQRKCDLRFVNRLRQDGTERMEL